MRKRTNLRNPNRHLEPTDSPEFAIYRALHEDKVNLELRTIARRGRWDKFGILFLETPRSPAVRFFSRRQRKEDLAGTA